MLDQSNSTKASIIAAYLRLKPLFEKLSADDRLTSANSGKNTSDKLRLDKVIVSLIDEILQINPEEYFAKFTEKEVDLLTKVISFLDQSWNVIPQETYIELLQMSAILRASWNEPVYTEKLHKKFYRTYQFFVVHYKHKLADKFKQRGISHLWEIKDKEGHTVETFLRSAEEKAIERIKDINDETQWITLPRSDKKLTAEEIAEYMRERGLS